jgi:general secretion pathway protein F
MSFYIASVANKGEVEKIKFEADSLVDAKKMASKRGRVLFVKENIWAVGSSTLRLTPRDRKIFLQRLSSMLFASVGTSESLRIIIETFRGNIKKAATRLLYYMEQNGDEMPDALKKMGRKAFPDNIIAIVSAGFNSGAPDWKTLEDAIEFEEELETIRNASNKGVGTSLFLFVLSGIIIISLRYYLAPVIIMPKMMEVFPEVDVALTDLVADYAAISMVFFMTIFVLLASLQTIGKRVAPVWADGIIRRIPFYKDLVLAKTNFITLYELSLMIGAGVSMESALAMSQKSAPPGAMKKDLGVAIVHIKTGKEWALAMSSFHATDRASLRVSSNRDEIAKILNKISAQYREDYIYVLASFGPFLKVFASIYLLLSGAVMFGYTTIPMLQLTAEMNI